MNCFAGTSNVGKTTTIKLVFETFRKSPSCNRIEQIYPKTRVSLPRLVGEIAFRVEINGVWIGFASAGDDLERYQDGVDVLVKKGCSIILCASKTYGKTVDHLDSVSKENNYNLKIVPLQKINGNVDVQNEQDATAMVADILFQIEQIKSKF